MAASSLVPLEGWDRVLDEDIVQFSALDIFPKEVWEMILDPLNDPKDLIRCRRVCKAWNEVLQRRRSLYIFSLVLPLLFRYLKKNDMLKCCKVGSSWKIAVDDINKVLVNTKQYRGFRLHFDNSNHLDRFLTAVQHQPSAPLNLAIYRHVTFNCPGMITDHNIMRYLGRFGRLVHHLGIFVYGYILLDVLRDSLCFTTNVTTLQVWTRDEYRRYVDPDPKQTLESYPLPNLPHLTNLVYHCSLSGPFNWLLLKYGAQMEKVEVSYVNLHLDILVPDKGVILSRLQKLDVTLAGRRHIENWRSLLKTHQVRLTQLTVKSSEVDATIASDIVEFINEFQSTLEELTVDYSTRECKAEFLEGLKLPHVKTLSIKHVGLPTPKILRSIAPRLSKLRIYFVGESKQSDKKFYKNLYYEHVFWETLPSIKSVAVTWLTIGISIEHFYFTRETYLQAEKKKEEIRALFASVCTVLLHSPIIGQLIGEK